MAFPTAARTKPRRPSLQQSTWPLMTNTIAVSGPPSASPFSPSSNAPNLRNVSEIIPRLYISDLAFAENPSALSSYRITHVLSTLPDTIFCPPPTLLPLQPARLQIRVDDLPFAELAAHLPTTTAFIRDALAHNPEARVLVHCVEGISRSVSVVAAYLMAQYGWTPVEAVQFVKSKRVVADPNFGFVQQLHEYARTALGRQQCVAPGVPQYCGGSTT
ncbi:dual specificity protein phosphatase 13 [Coprinopsis cinerea okayama7|uniref:protein-tyrosine-phosphatase n=1 Tax=Coprinopsis cinerea (strain Okayama-7 / 130 / ATCC MYA-4618 / FGSC 9003) TaxID=240176 RepID=A8PG51_COPC7|nr:dual specificity protein phosphatase 13 [Coprinopsis cinerea okayama7\|eukprot:XP_001841148.2 dual specificity protein phosphatase 13 [Coprinopsis cinerea okayama7\